MLENKKCTCNSFFKKETYDWGTKYLCEGNLCEIKVNHSGEITYYWVYYNFSHEDKIIVNANKKENVTNIVIIIPGTKFRINRYLDLDLIDLEKSINNVVNKILKLNCFS